jgi:GrpB-like predicted nucleotidyltransferase (UPF0157 family)
VDDDLELIGGPEQVPIVVVPADPTWPRTAAAHIRRVRATLVPTLGAVRVEHVGSTSVPGLAAKPIVDLQLSVPDVDAEARYLPALASAGYVLRVRERAWRHRMLRTPARDVHLHVCDVGGDWERRHLLFRDHLRANVDDAARYAAVKHELAARDWMTMQHYAEAKTDIIAAITARAERWASVSGWTPTSGSGACRHDP